MLGWAVRWRRGRRRLECLRSLDQLVFHRRLYRQVAGLLTLEDTIHIAGCAPVLVDHIGPVGDQASAGNKGALEIDKSASSVCLS